MKKVLFICVGNSCRSQMAEGFANHLGKEIIEAISAGTQPAERVASFAVEAMKEKGIDISNHEPKMLTMEMLNSADYVISMGCGVEESCPLPLRKDTVDWGLDDPHGQGIDKYREVRDEIERRVKNLLEKINDCDH